MYVFIWKNFQDKLKSEKKVKTWRIIFKVCLYLTRYTHMCICVYIFQEESKKNMFSELYLGETARE